MELSKLAVILGHKLEVIKLSDPMLQKICLYCNNHRCRSKQEGIGAFLTECRNYEPATANNVCPDCGFHHAETLPAKCKNCGREFPENQSILMSAVEKGHVTDKEASAENFKVKKVDKSAESEKKERAITEGIRNAGLVTL